MYYPQQSPGIAHKLASHHEQNPWSRNHHPVLGPPGSQPALGPPPTSPGYTMYSNGGVSGMQHHPGHMQHPLGHPGQLQHHHQNSLSHFPSPPNGHNHQPAVINPASPAAISAEPVSHNWSQQLLKCELVRASRSPFHRAKASAMASRTVARNAILITNPNIVKTPSSEEPPDPQPSPTTSSAVANRPTAIVGPIAESRPENVWTSLDMGGVGIKNLPSNSGLFSFTFLLNLYLNHNSLSHVPPEIAKLRHLELLDLSGNGLYTLPAELGMLSKLKELYVFDNQLATLPPQLGTLHQLQTLGVEGNPLDAELQGIIKTQGSQGLIAHLRDHCPNPPTPPPREWKTLLTLPEQEVLTSDPYGEVFTVQCFNILCDRGATERIFGYTPSWALNWEYRRREIMKEITARNCDFICLQEVDIARYEDYFMGTLEEMGYEGVYWPKSRYKTKNDRLVDGCATFFRSSRFQLVEKHLIEFNVLAMARPDFEKTDHMFTRVLGKDHIGVVCLLEDKRTRTRVIVANTHIHWDQAHPDVKLVQVGLLVDEVEKIAADFARYPPPPPLVPGENGDAASRPAPVYTDATKIPLILCGDFNSIPSSGVYEFLSTGSLSPKHPDFLSHLYGKFTSEGLRHRLGLKSAYLGPGADLLLTNNTAGFKGVLDYIWYSTANLGLNQVLSEVDRGYLEKVVGFPNPHFPSDHVSIAAEFRVKPPRETPPRPPPPNS